MQADQMRSTRAHRIHIQPVRHLPDAPRLMVGARLQLGQRCLDGALHRRLILLPLPSGKGRTIVFNLKSISGHVLPYRWRERGTIPHLSPLVTQGGSAYP